MKITVPTSFEDINLGQYLELGKIDPSDTLGQIAILCDISKEDIKRMEKSSLIELEALLSSIEQTDEDKYKHERFIELRGLKYGFHPNLSEMSVGEFVDLDSLCQNPLENLPKIMAILYRPVIEEAFQSYQIKPYTSHEDSEIMLEMKMPDVLGSLNFFLSLGMSFVKNSLPSLKEEKPQT